MNSKQALEYLYEATVIEPTMADERAEAAVNVLRVFIRAVERIAIRLYRKGNGTSVVADELMQEVLNARE